MPGLLVIDGGRTASYTLAGLPQASLHDWRHETPFTFVRCPVPDRSLSQLRDLQYFIESRLTEGLEVWLRLDGPVREPALASCAPPVPRRCCSPRCTMDDRRLPAGNRRNSCRYVGLAPCGVVAMNDVAAPVSA